MEFFSESPSSSWASSRTPALPRRSSRAPRPGRALLWCSSGPSVAARKFSDTPVPGHSLADRLTRWSIGRNSRQGATTPRGGKSDFPLGPSVRSGHSSCGRQRCRAGVLDRSPPFPLPHYLLLSTPRAARLNRGCRPDSDSFEESRSRGSGGDQELWFRDPSPRPRRSAPRSHRSPRSPCPRGAGSCPSVR